jgi:hypothetical protein
LNESGNVEAASKPLVVAAAAAATNGHCHGHENNGHSITDDEAAPADCETEPAVVPRPHKSSSPLTNGKANGNGQNRSNNKVRYFQHINR